MNQSTSVFNQIKNQKIRFGSMIIYSKFVRPYLKGTVILQFKDMTFFYTTKI